MASDQGEPVQPLDSPARRIVARGREATDRRLRAWNVRDMDVSVRDAIRELGDARGWTIAETLQHMLQFVRDAQLLADGGLYSEGLKLDLMSEEPNAKSLWPVLLEHHGLAYVKR